MRKDHRPYVLKKTWLKLQKFYARHFLRPQLDGLGRGFTFLRPWHVKLFGSPIVLGRYITIIADPDGKVRLSVWPHQSGSGSIRIDDYVLICPGVRISSADRIRIHDNCMLANGVYITDSDWHGVYDRMSLGRTAPVTLEKNVWVGDSAIVCKGVTIGQNSIVGAGAVVTNDIPANCIAAGNPAQVVKHLDPLETFTTRANWYAEPEKLAREFVKWDQSVLKGNTFFGWLRHALFPQQEE